MEFLRWADHRIGKAAVELGSDSQTQVGLSESEATEAIRRVLLHVVQDPDNVLDVMLESAQNCLD